MNPGGSPNHVAGQSKPPFSANRSWLYIFIVVVVATLVAIGVWWMAEEIAKQNTAATQLESPVIPTKSTAKPQLTTAVVLGKRDHVWDLGFLPTKEMIFTERSKGQINLLKDGKVTQLEAPTDVLKAGEGGILGLAVDPKFEDNRYIYTCFNSNLGGPNVRVVRWHAEEDLSGLTDRTDIITGMPSRLSGRHSGCRLAFGPDGYLWVTTGDSATGGVPMDPESLGGKILRVDRDGKAAPGNLAGNYDSRIFSYGHRNVQGIAFFAKAQQGAPGISVEHGSNEDDEVNLLKKGNFGWGPPAGSYQEHVPMTDKKKFPNAIEAIWSSGNPTQAPSGASFVNGPQWKAWDGALFVCFLKDRHLKVMLIDENNKLTDEVELFKGKFGRIRAATQGPDGNLYITTDNGNDADQIIRITPH